MLLIGRLPRLHPSFVHYTSAYAGQKIRAQRIRLSFWSPGEQRAGPARSVAAATAGLIVESPEIFTELQRVQPAHYLQVNVKLPPPSRGFLLRKAFIEDAQGHPRLEWADIVAAAGSPLPDIEQYRTLVTSIDEARKLFEAGAALDKGQGPLRQALAINPHEPAALRVGADISRRLADPRGAAEALVLLVEAGPGDGARFAETGGQLFQAGDLAQAETMLVHARESGVSNAATTEQLARIHIARKDYSGGMPVRS